MKKHLYLGICILALTACGTGRVGQKNATLADMFVWGQKDNANVVVETTPTSVVSIPLEMYNDKCRNFQQKYSLKYLDC